MFFLAALATGFFAVFFATFATFFAVGFFAFTVFLPAAFVVFFATAFLAVFVVFVVFAISVCSFTFYSKMNMILTPLKGFYNRLSCSQRVFFYFSSFGFTKAAHTRSAFAMWVSTQFAIYK